MNLIMTVSLTQDQGRCLERQIRERCFGVFKNHHIHYL